MKKRNIIICTICGAVLCAAVWLVYSSRMVHCQTAEEYTEHGGRLLFEIPQTAENCRFAMRKGLLSRLYLYAFQLDEAACDEYLDALRVQYKLDSSDESDRLYSYAHWYNMQAADCVTGDVMQDFPLHLPFDAVTERQIGDGTVIVYYPVQTGGKSFAAVLFPDTGEFVCYEHLTR